MTASRPAATGAFSPPPGQPLANSVHDRGERPRRGGARRGAAARLREIAQTAAPASLEELAAGAPVLALAPHPDDESLGCGALLAAAFASSGARVVALTDGEASHPASRRYPPPRLAQVRRAELAAAVRRLGGRPRDVVRLGQPDGALPAEGATFEGLAAEIARLARSAGARTLFVTSAADPHRDHGAAEALARRAAALAGDLSVRTYPVWARHRADADLSPLANARALRFPSAPFRPRKRAAVAAHASQHGRLVRDDPDGFVLPRSLVDALVEEDELFFEVAP